jgi:membrane-associated protease RseP (regulator of RpoE activity)
MPNWLLVLTVIAFGWLMVLHLEKRGRLKAERYSLLLVLRTERGRELLSRIAAHRRFWRAYSSLGVLIGVVGIPLILFLIYHSLYSRYYLSVPMPKGGVTLVIPGVTIPFTYGVIGLVTVLFFHEISHGIIARSENISLKNLGIALLTIIPIGAFVEPDEEEFSLRSRMTKLRVYAAGSFGNFLVALPVALLILSPFFSFFFYQEDAVVIQGVVVGSPAEGILEPGMVIREIDGLSITSIRDFSRAAEGLRVGEQVEIRTGRGIHSIVLGENPRIPGRGYMGISVATPLREGLPGFLYSSLWWIAFLNAGIGLTNLAPLHLGIAATDGHHILREILSGILRDREAEKISLFISSLTMISILFLVMDPFWTVL